VNSSTSSTSGVPLGIHASIPHGSCLCKAFHIQDRLPHTSFPSGYHRDPPFCLSFYLCFYPHSSSSPEGPFPDILFFTYTLKAGGVPSRCLPARPFRVVAVLLSSSPLNMLQNLSKKKGCPETPLLSEKPYISGGYSAPSGSSSGPEAASSGSSLSASSNPRASRFTKVSL